MRERLDDEDEAKEAKNTAARLLGEVEQLDVSIGRMSDQLREVEAELEKLNASP